MACFFFGKLLLYSISIANSSWLKIVFQSVENVIIGMGRNQGVSLESGGFNDQVYGSVVCMRKIKECIVNSCNFLLLLIMLGVDCGGGRMWGEQY